MLHKLFEPGDWFEHKKHGYGSGAPIAWQGWVLMTAYLAIMGGLGLLIKLGDQIEMAIGIIGMVLASGAFIIIARKRTRGGWKWRKPGDGSDPKSD